MTEKLFKFLPFLLIAYASWQSFNIFEEETTKTETMEMQIAPSEANNVKLRKRIEEVKLNESKIAEYEKRIIDLQKQMEELKTKMPPESDKTAVLQELRNSAQTINLKEVTFNPGTRKDNGLYFSNGIDIKGRGTFLQYLIFLEQCYSGKRLLNISKFLMTASDKQTKGRFFFVKVETQLETYEYNVNYVPPAPPVAVAPEKAKEGK
ncbi:MAG: type 4a pilus biogenesis protein PilO [Bacteriovoracaceae bacterium]|nr:type 4a pilus biogenesis protein PilO [Bacteriovoracaceae bacterium]